MSEIIYEAKFSEKKDIPEKPDFSLYDAETQEFINSSIAYAEKSKSDIVISKDMYDIRSVIYVTIGMFFGGFKKAFLHFAMKSKDFLILPMNGHSNFTLKISATYNMVCKNSPMIKRVVVAGSRSFTDYEQAKKIIDRYIDKIRKKYTLVFVSGCCRGADSLGERYARENGFHIERCPAEWNKYGNAAGPRRNKQMAEICDYVICFWDGKSNGTKSMIDYALKYNKPIKIKRYVEEKKEIHSEG